MFTTNFRRALNFLNDLNLIVCPINKGFEIKVKGIGLYDEIVKPKYLSSKGVIEFASRKGFISINM